MFYTLTEEEYAALKDAAKLGSRMPTEKQLKKLCIQIADTMPVKWTWGPGKDEPRPWGCIETHSDWHCDECPVRTICPGPKDFSQ